MRWVRYPTGDKVHAVPRGAACALCGLGLVGASLAAPPGFDNRCESCDEEWRHRGRAEKPKLNRPDPRIVYRPRFKFEDWEEADG